MSGAAGHGSCRDERIEDGFLRSVRHGLEEKVELVDFETLGVGAGPCLRRQ